MRNTADTDAATANSELYTANTEPPSAMTKKSASPLYKFHRK